MSVVLVDGEVVVIELLFFVEMVIEEMDLLIKGVLVFFCIKLVCMLIGLVV